MTISSHDQFIKYLNENSLSSSDKLLDSATLSVLNFEWFLMLGFKFINCKFINCSFENFEFNGVSFEKCSFNGCIFQDVQFMDCSIIECQLNNPFSNSLYFGMSILRDVTIINSELQYTTFSDCSIDTVIFTGGSFRVGRFESGDFTYRYKTKFIFEKGDLWDIVFIDLDLSEATIRDCKVQFGFVRCKLARISLLSNSRVNDCSIDFSTIIESEELATDALHDVFGIKERNVKQQIKALMDSPKFHTVFISYSFKDGWIAKQIKYDLEKHGIRSFLWENDAPGGKKLKQIMRDGIRDYDKFLIILSENSLKSEACQFEISQAREKYNKTWMDVLVPIHIDHFLFEIGEDDIPRRFRKEYWDNVLELREIASIDFTFANPNLHISDSKQMDILIGTLKKSITYSQT